MTAQSADETPGARDRGHLRTSRADREQVVEVVKAAFVQGRLAKDEFDQRLGRVFASRTYADLASLTADIPPVVVRAQSLREAAQPPARMATDKNAIRAWASATAVLPAMVVAASALESGQPVIFGLIVAFVFACLVALPVSGLVMLHSWHEKRSGHETG